MKDYYKLFVEYSMQQCAKDEYINPQKVKSHNLAAKKLVRLQEEMQKQDYCKILEELLNHESDVVKINAASMCINMGRYIEEVAIVLEKIICHSNEPFVVFSAKNLVSRLNNSKGRQGD